MEFKGYGADAAFDGATLRLSAKTTLAFGAKERLIPIHAVDAITFKPASMLTNGCITVQSGRAKYQVHFLKKVQDAANELYAAVLATSGVAPDAIPVGEVRHDALDAAADRLATAAASLQAKRVADAVLRVEAKLTALGAVPEDGEAQAEDLAESLLDGWAETPSPVALAPTASLTRADSKKAVAAARAESKQRAAASRAEAKQLNASNRAEAAAARAQVKDDKKAAKVAATEAEEAVIRAFSLGQLPAYIDEHGLPEGLNGWAHVDRHFRAATDHAKAGEIEAEEASIRTALESAKTLGGRAMRKKTEERIEAATGRSLRIGSTLIGRVEAEDFFSQHSRKGKLLSVSTAEKWCIVRSDRVLTSKKAYAIDASTTAQVYLDGQALVTQRPTLTRMALLSPLPGSALIPGLALQKKEKVDTRQGEFQVGGLGWSLRVMVHPDKLSTPRQMAEQINRHANVMATQNAPAAPVPTVSTAPIAKAPSNDDVLSRLERLQALVTSGAISQDEAEALKQDILAR